MTTSLNAPLSRPAGAPGVSAAPHTESISSTATPRFVHSLEMAALLQRRRTTPKRPRPIALRLAPAFSHDPVPRIAAAPPGSRTPPAGADAAAHGDE